ncbi:MAG: response regulator [Deltaproteobacteria bacterium]|nr:response regulator [Deltaproteobacteria bacterium]
MKKSMISDQIFVDGLTTVLAETRSRLCNALYLVFLILLIPTAITIIMRATTSGWNSLTLFQLSLFSIVISGFLLRKKMTYKARALILIGAIFLAAVSGIINWGLMGNGISAVFFCIVAATILLGTRFGAIQAVLGILSIVIIGFLVVQQSIQFDFDLKAFSESPNSWISSIITITLFSAPVVFSLGQIYDGLASAYRELNNRSDELEKINEQLISEIVERKNAEEELLKAHDELEDRVKLRTQQLENQTLELRNAKEAAETANKAKSAFLSNMSHELRTPLNAILGFSQLMERDSTISPSQKESTAIINRSGGHLLGLINDILDMSKIEAGHISLNQQAFDFERTLQNVVEMIRIRAEMKGLVLELKASSSLPKIVKTDERKLRQVLINLLGNAVKFTKEGGIVLKVDFEVKKSVPHLFFEIADTGVGISDDQFKTLFEPFTQVETLSHTKEGTGLGLAISRQYVRLLGGDISMESHPGQGSVFGFDFPVELSQESEQPLKDERSVIGLADDQPKYRILVVEDVEENRLLLRKMLHMAGFEMREAANGQQAIEQFQQWQPNFIWMDIRMPVMDGFQATQTIRSLSSGDAVKIVALTASVFEGDREQLFACGCDDYVLKPFKDIQIYNMMAKHLGVSYRYQDSDSQHAKLKLPITTHSLKPENLAALPANLLLKLEQALIHIDIEDINSAIEEIGSYNPTTAKSLKAIAQDYKHETIWQLIQQVKGEHD